MPAKPTLEQLRIIAQTYNLHLSDEDIETFRAVMDGTFASHPSLRIAPHATPMVEALTAREREVLSLLIVGASNREIAEQLVLSVNTVKKHVLNLCGKLGVQSRTQAIARARALEWL